MKVMLIHPPMTSFLNAVQSNEKPYTLIPLSLATIGGVLKQEGYDVRISDMAGYSWDEVEREIEKEDPDVVGISCLTPNRMQSVRVARIAKEVNPDIKIIFGGIHASFFPEHMFQLAPTDAVVIGEGEITIVELLRAMETNGDLSNVKGVAYKKDGNIVKTDPRPSIQDLDILPFPYYDDFDFKKYKPVGFFGLYEELTTSIVMTSRGCPFMCEFCSSPRFWGRSIRVRSPSKVVDEIELLVNKYGVQHIIFMDDTFGVRREHAIGICKEMINRNVDVPWFTETRANCVDKEMLEWMKKAGCWKVLYGVESGSPKILKNIKKLVTIDQIKQAFKITREAGLKAGAFLMIGNPGENEQTINDTINLAKEIQLDTLPYVSITMIFPNTALYDLAKSQGLLSDKYWLTDNPIPIYTVEWTLEQLLLLRFKLGRGLMKSQGTVKYLKYILNAISKDPKRFLNLLPHYLKMEFKSKVQDNLKNDGQTKTISNAVRGNIIKN